MDRNSFIAIVVWGRWLGVFWVIFAPTLFLWLWGFNTVDGDRIALVTTAPGWLMAGFVVGQSLFQVCIVALLDAWLEAHREAENAEKGSGVA